MHNKLKNILILKKLYSSFILRYERLYRFIRLQRPITKLFGPHFKRSHKVIDIDVTYLCNLNCINCSRSLGQIKSNEIITIKQIKKFIKESKDNNIIWKEIKVVGGEPTLHPNINQILNLLLDYKKKYSPNTIIKICTNSYGKKVKQILTKIPKDIMIRSFPKKSKYNLFFPFNVAPKDCKMFKFADYSNGCSLLNICGLGLNMYGYYPCAHAAGIDRIFGFNIGRKKIPCFEDDMVDQLNQFCKLCGYFRPVKRTKKEKISVSWKKAFQKYKNKKPYMSSY